MQFGYLPYARKRNRIDAAPGALLSSQWQREQLEYRYINFLCLGISVSLSWHLHFAYMITTKSFSTQIQNIYIGYAVQDAFTEFISLNIIQAHPWTTKTVGHGSPNPSETIKSSLAFKVTV